MGCIGPFRQYRKCTQSTDISGSAGVQTGPCTTVRTAAYSKRSKPGSPGRHNAWLRAALSTSKGMAEIEEVWAVRRAKAARAAVAAALEELTVGTDKPGMG
eukprot:5483056-Pleurochrysis_carterae.AAC.4